jgi:hypothetical protein
VFPELKVSLKESRLDWVQEKTVGHRSNLFRFLYEMLGKTGTVGVV